MPRDKNDATEGGSSLLGEAASAYPAYRAVLGKQGRLVVPAEIRDALGLAPGAPLSLRLENGRLIIERPDAILRGLQGRFQKAPGESGVVDELIRERREAFRREDTD